MKKELQLKDEETLSDWITRISIKLNFDTETENIVREVCRESYIKGFNCEIDNYQPADLDSYKIKGILHELGNLEKVAENITHILNQ